MADAAEAGRRLKEAREAAGRTLEELSRATRINARFLSEIEEGSGFSLPAVYRRTFIRTYARELGVDPDEVTPEEPAAPAPGGETGRAPDTARPAEIAPGPPVEKGVHAAVSGSPFVESSQLRTMAIVVILLVTALVMSVKWLGSDGGEAPRPSATAGPDSAGQAEPGRATPFAPRERGNALQSALTAPADSLVLHATTTESVWVHIVIDNDSSIEYTLPPRYALTLRAKENFLLAVGNPAGLSLSLNGRKVEVQGEGNRPLKNVFLSRKSIPE